VFWTAGIYGILVTLPLFFNERLMGEKYPPAITHAEYYYTFAALALLWQIIFIVIARDPGRYRAFMIFCVCEKLCLLPTFFILYPAGRYPDLWLPLICIDLLFGVLFGVSYKLTRKVK
jgi:hypothetical protein